MSNQVAKKTDSATSVRKLIESQRANLEKALPEICSGERFVRVAMTAITKNPKLADCDQRSLMVALLDCASLGIEPDNRRAHLIPFNKSVKQPDGSWKKVPQVQLIIDYKGLVELVRRSGEVSKIHADVVCDNDIFEYDCGEVTQHKINFKGSRGNVYAVYAFAEMKSGEKQTCVMTVEEVEKIREASLGKNSDPWKIHWNEMAKKTVFRRLCKWLPLSSENLELISRDDTQFNKPKVEIDLGDEEEVIEG